jgi:hypothetical protein
VVITVGIGANLEPNLYMNHPIGIAGLLRGTVDVVVMILYWFQMPSSFILFPQAIINAHKQLPLVTPFSQCHQILDHKATDRFSDLNPRPRADPQTVGRIGGVGSIHDQPIQPFEGLIGYVTGNDRIR